MGKLSYLVRRRQPDWIGIAMRHIQHYTMPGRQPNYFALLLIAGQIHAAPFGAMTQNKTEAPRQTSYKETKIGIMIFFNYITYYSLTNNIKDNHEISHSKAADDGQFS